MSKNAMAAPKNILIVEDDKLSATALKFLLESLNQSVTVAETGISAITAYKYSLFDMVICDVGLPDISGNEVCERIKEFIKRDGVFTPVIALSANQFTDEEKNNFCFDKYLTKPMTAEKLERLLNEFANLPRKKEVNHGKRCK